MKKRIALIILIALYLIVPAVIKRLPLYEYIPVEKHKSFYNNDELTLLEKDYEKNKQTITFTIMENDFTGELREFKGDMAIYRGKQGECYYEYWINMKNNDNFYFKVNDANFGIKIENPEGITVTDDIVLSRYISINRYEKYQDGILYIDGYQTLERATVFVVDNKLCILDLRYYGIFSDSELGIKINENQLALISKIAAYVDYDKLFELDKDRKNNCLIQKNEKGEIFISIFVGSDNVTGKACYVYIRLFPRTAWIISKYVLGISATLMFTWVIVSEIRAHKRKKSAPIPSEQEEQAE